jgi:NADPH:quinone reductase-like Zn-dependent oxidoreductase
MQVRMAPAGFVKVWNGVVVEQEAFRRMRACLIEKFGSLEEQLQIANVGLPLAGPDELLVKVFAASVNPSDWKLIDGRLQALFPVTLPRILGRDCAGEIVSGRAAGLAIGDRVLAVADTRKNGTHAEYAVVPSCQAAPVPASLSNEQAVAIGNSGATAWICLIDVARIASGQRVLIHGGAGAVAGWRSSSRATSEPR